MDKTMNRSKEFRKNLYRATSISSECGISDSEGLKLKIYNMATIKEQHQIKYKT
ncbi:MAG: hypothetical protein U9N59_01755 [Campylobacterota bacterium]|nr:hypothetical protein [Campylobacterota bacterium]